MYFGRKENMNIVRISIGNKNEAFVSPYFSNGINLIYSDDNNKGKTILIQAIGYSLGNKPFFPVGFNYKDYFFVLEFEHDKKKYSICRKNNNYIVSDIDGHLLLNGESEFKKWFNNNVFDIPKIIKDNRIIIADFELLLQIFYLGQDKRDTSNIHSGYFKKEDLISTISYLCGNTNLCINNDCEKINNEIIDLKRREKEILRKTKLIKKIKKEIIVVSNYADNADFARIKEEIDELLTTKSELVRKRNRLYARIRSNDLTISEINSINVSLDKGELICKDCGSKNIVYVANKDISFDVSSDELRRKIISSIKNINNNLYSELDNIKINIENATNKLAELINGNKENANDILLSSDDINYDLTYESELEEISKEKDIKVSAYNKLIEEIKEDNKRKNDVLNQIVNCVTNLYRKFDKDDEAIIGDIFSKNSEIYSGSENTVFFISRLIAFEIKLKHKFPIIIDGFREGEISTPTEKKILDEFKKIKKQIILTATLKDEEYHKYDNDEGINRIDLSDVISKHLLQKDYVIDFAQIIAKFGISL